MEELQKKIQELIMNISKDDFIFDLLSIYGNTKTTIKRLRDGDKNKLAEKGELELRSKLFFKVVHSDLYSTIDDVKNKLKGKRTNPRFVIVTDYETLLTYDTKTKDTLDIKIKELDKKYNFFLPWIGIEKTEYLDENIADVKAAQDLAKLYDEIIKANPHETEEDIHDLNIFLSRLLFCYFAEDTDIFTKNQFTHALGSHTNDNGEDTKNLLETIFTIFNQKESERKNDLPDYLSNFPYVNGKLFAEEYSIPSFTTKSRKFLLDMGGLDWSEINPDIFGSMMQAVASDEDRSNFGKHYTSVPNIMKLIKPLFLDELLEEFENSIGNTKKLETLRSRISKIKFFDPACGSGNFLIIAYKEIRRLEIDVIKELQVGSNLLLPGMRSFLSDVKLSQFYGIEIDNFACETAKLSMYLTKHQMDMEFEKETGFDTQPLPLKEGGNIVQGNAVRVDWESVCPKEENDEIYIMGNPPYQGKSKQSKNQKSDMEYVFRGVKNYKSLDYISCWFYKTSQYIKELNSKGSFVTTNSVTQGEQVDLLWHLIFGIDIEIDFAYQSFKWVNNAKNNAGVSVVIIGLRNISKNKKYIYKNKLKKEVENISPYLIEGSDIIITKKASSISKLPEMVSGNKPVDGGNLILTQSEYESYIREYPGIGKYIKKFIGANELMNKTVRYCLWIEDKYKTESLKYKIIKERIEATSNFRLKSKDIGAQKLSQKSHQFRDFFYTKKTSIIIPQTGSERRKYLPIGLADDEVIISNAARVIYDADIWVFGLLSSNIHITWVRAVAGRLKMDMQYSNTLCYNTFPFPKITEQQKEDITDHVHEILDERSRHSEKTLAQMYDPDKMPEGLKNVHHQLDLAIEKIYRSKPFENDEERLEYLFKLYEKMIAKEQEIISNNKK
jgi:hypothetical protein